MSAESPERTLGAAFNAAHAADQFRRIAGFGYCSYTGEDRP